MSAVDLSAPFVDRESRGGALSYARALLNILEDTASEKDQLRETQSAALNILEDAGAEKEHLHEMQSAALNILEDFASDKIHLEDMKKSVLNILEDLGVEKLQLGEQTIQLEAANRELEAFSYSVSHDLRAPLRGIDGWSAALLEDYGGQLEGRAKQYLERLRSETQRLGRLIDDLLHLSRVSRMEMERQHVDLTALAQAVAARLTEAHPDQAIEFLIKSGLTARADAPLIEVVLTNLLDNAVKFATRKPQARVEVGQTQVEGEPAFFVRDNGAGFDMEYVSALFGAFQRLHKVTEFPGTGIGLATVQRVIHRHGGRVWAEAQVDAGATFYFTLGAHRAGRRGASEVTR